MENTKRTELEMLFSSKLTENGDNAFTSTGDKMLDILFMSEYYRDQIRKAHKKCIRLKKQHDKLKSLLGNINKPYIRKKILEITKII